MNEKDLNEFVDEATDLDEEMFVTLTFDDGEEVECAILTILTVEDKDYIALYPMDADLENDETEIFIYRYKENADGEPELENIESDEEYDSVADAFDEFLSEEE